MSLRERTRPGLGIVEPRLSKATPTPSHARYSDFRRVPCANQRGDDRLSFFRYTAIIALRLVFSWNGCRACHNEH